MTITAEKVELWFNALVYVLWSVQALHGQSGFPVTCIMPGSQGDCKEVNCM